MIPHLYPYLHRHGELVLPSNKVRQETENKDARDGLYFGYIINVILPRTFMTNGRKVLQKRLKVTSLIEAEESVSIFRLSSSYRIKASQQAEM